MDGSVDPRRPADPLHANVRLPGDAFADLCKRFHVRRLSLFGSALRDDFHAGSDVDVLIEYEHDYQPAMDYFEMKEELEAWFGRKVDLVSLRMVENPYRRAEILRTRRIVHESPSS